MREHKLAGRSLLPGKAKFGGYIYLVEFDNGTVKVGSTANPRARFETFRREAHAFGLSIVETWLSVLHDGYQGNEETLLGLAAEHGTRRDGREYFTGTTLAELRTRAVELNFPPVDVAAHEAEQARAGEKARALVEGFSQASQKDEDPIRRALAPFFGWDHRTQTYSISEKAEEPLPVDAIERMAEASGESIEEVLAMDFIDLLERTLTTSVRVEALRLRTYALQSGRLDLTKKLRDAG